MSNERESIRIVADWLEETKNHKGANRTFREHLTNVVIAASESWDRAEEIRSLEARLELVTRLWELAFGVKAEARQDAQNAALWDAINSLRLEVQKLMDREATECDTEV